MMLRPIASSRVYLVPGYRDMPKSIPKKSNLIRLNSSPWKQIISFWNTRMPYSLSRYDFFQASLYVRKTEKLSAGELRQMFLFDEAEAVVDGIAPEDKESEEVTVAAHTRKKSGRKALPESLSRVER